MSIDLLSLVQTEKKLNLGKALLSNNENNIPKLLVLKILLKD